MKIMPLYVFFGLLVGFFLVYLLTPKPKIIMKTPNIKNCEDTMYVDDIGVCYKYKKIKVDCNK